MRSLFLQVRAVTMATALALPAACSFDSSGSQRPSADAAGDRDGSLPDADASAFDATPGDPCESWTPAAPFEPCSIEKADRTFEMVLDEAGTYTYDTDSGELRDPGDTVIAGPPSAVSDADYRLISVGLLQIFSGSRLRVTGSFPLLIAAWGAVDIDGAIDVSSTGDDLGAGARATPCDAMQNGETDVTEPAGGGGGGFGGAGGPGGSGPTPGGAIFEGEPGLRGGCGGGLGGAGALGTAGGGASGGAVALSGLFSIVIEGSIQAGGAGGEGGSELGGGGGAGSGGLIWLEARGGVFVGAVGILASNGGGGGEGSDLDTPGDPGQDANQNGVSKAPGGKGGGAGDGGDGGDGSVGVATDGASGKNGNASGGGGGGGGAGIIRLDGDFDPDANAVVSPAETRY